MSTVAVIFAGGKGQRLGGVDKALQPLGDQPLIGHIIARLEPQTVRIVINANGDPGRFAKFGLDVVSDLSGSALDGPFLALATALRVFADDASASHLLTVPTDTPFLPDDLVARLQAAGSPAAWAAADGQHPTICLWSRQGAARADQQLARFSGQRLEDVIRACGGQAVGFDNADQFLNINRPVDLKKAIDIKGG